MFAMELIKATPKAAEGPFRNEVGNAATIPADALVFQPGDHCLQHWPLVRRLDISILLMTDKRHCEQSVIHFSCFQVADLNESPDSVVIWRDVPV